MTPHTPKTESPVALITGGGSGIGRATAVRLADHGWHVRVIGRRETPLKEVAALRSAISYTVADITDADQARQAVDHVIVEYGRLDALVNNAGMLAPTPLHAVNVDDLTRLFGVNVFAAARLVSLCLSPLAETAGSIVNVSSAVAQRPGLRATVLGASWAGLFYGASKAALDYLTRSWAVELADCRIRVNAVASGPIETPLADGLLPAAQLAQVKQNLVDSLPLRRPGEPEDVARWIHTLVDPASSWVTGQIIAVDGGMAIP
jgi:NAD(P)-dependent dehydrogenase (short-subunit alcohol dehydrogenase family)